MRCHGGIRGSRLGAAPRRHQGGETGSETRHGATAASWSKTGCGTLTFKAPTPLWVLCTQSHFPRPRSKLCRTNPRVGIQGLTSWSLSCKSKTMSMSCTVPAAWCCCVRDAVPSLAPLMQPWHRIWSRSLMPPWHRAQSRSPVLTMRFNLMRFRSVPTPETLICIVKATRGCDHGEAMRSAGDAP